MRQQETPWLYPNRTLDYLPSRSFIEFDLGGIDFGRAARTGLALVRQPRGQM